MHKEKGLEEARVLALTGEGRIVAKPDQANIQLVVAATAASAQEAVRKSQALLGSVFQRLKAIAVSAEELQTSGLTITPLIEREEGLEPSGRVTAYRVEEILTIKVDVQRAAQVLDEGMAAGATIAGGIAFRARDEATYRAQALKAAAEAAQREAETVAQAMGVKLRGRRNAEVIYGGSPEIYRAIAQKDEMRSPEPGTLLFTAGIRITYDFRD